jgi:hypothetical protein
MESETKKLVNASRVTPDQVAGRVLEVMQPIQRPALFIAGAKDPVNCLDGKRTSFFEALLHQRDDFGFLVGAFS